MVKRGRPQTRGLRWHGGKGRWFRLYAGKAKYFGPTGQKSKTPDGSVYPAAEQAWILFEAGRQPVQTVGNAVLAPLPHLTIAGPTCQDVIDAYLEYCKAETSPQHYFDAKALLSLSRGRNLTPPTCLDHFGALRPIAALTREQFQTYRRKINGLVSDNKVKQSYANRFFRHVKAAFNHGIIEKGWSSPILSDCLKMLKTKTAGQTDVPIFSAADYRRMFDSFDAKFRAIALIALNAALTNTDIAYMTWDCIKWDDVYFDMPRRKQGGLRRTPLWARTLEALRTLRDKSNNDLVFPNSCGGPLITLTGGSRNDHLAANFRRRMQDLGMSYTFGSFRKSAATVAKRAVDADTVKMLLGDAPNETWKRHYVMTYPDNVLKATTEIERYYFGE